MKNGSLVLFFLLSFSLGFVYLFFISDYSLVELRKKEAHLDFLKNSFYQEKSEHEYLLRLQESDDKNLTKYLNEYGFIKNDEILVDIQVPETDSFFKGEEDVFFISKSSVIFLTVLLVMLALALLWFYRTNKTQKSLVERS